MKKLLVLTSILLTTGSVVFATSTFGTLSDFTVGTGNPNNAFQITTIVNGANTITLGLQAQQRYNNPVLANNGAGTYYADPGANYGTPATPTTPGTPSNFKGSTWNFDFYLDATAGSYTYKLFYGLDGSALLSFDPTLVSDNKATPLNHGGQNSDNLLFSNFGGVLNTLSFDPNANAIYDFELVAYNNDNAAIGSSAIKVVVGTVHFVTSTGILLGLGFVGLMVFGIRQNRLQAAK